MGENFRISEAIKTFSSVYCLEMVVGEKAGLHVAAGRLTSACRATGGTAAVEDLEIVVAEKAGLHVAAGRFTACRATGRTTLR